MRCGRRRLGRGLGGSQLPQSFQKEGATLPKHGPPRLVPSSAAAACNGPHVCAARSEAASQHLYGIFIPTAMSPGVVAIRPVRLPLGGSQPWGRTVAAAAAAAAVTHRSEPPQPPPTPAGNPQRRARVQMPSQHSPHERTGMSSSRDRRRSIILASSSTNWTMERRLDKNPSPPARCCTCQSTQMTWAEEHAALEAIRTRPYQP